MKITKSLELLERAKKVIPGQTSTISKRYGRLPMGVAPAYMDWGIGCNVYDVDHNEYLDWSASLGTKILGYGGVIRGKDIPLFSKQSLPLSHFHEVILAEKLVDIIPCAEMVRFFKNGSDACTAAVMLARMDYNKKGNILYSGYHGWHDWGSIGEQYAIKIPYGNIEALENSLDRYDPDCYILEPMDRSCPEKYDSNYLEDVRLLCDKYNVILIFDEILTGFRYGLSGISGRSGIIPDLACYGKAMGNGAPISALVGNRELMKEMEDMRISGTYFTDPNAFSYALHTIDFIEQNHVMNHVWDIGERLKKEIKEVIKESNMDGDVRVKGFGPWNSFVWKEEVFNEQQLFLQEIFNRGIFYNRDHFAMFAHTDKEVEKTVAIYKEVLEYVFAMRQNYFVRENLMSEVDRRLFV